jgi:quercetin dioxygenase-like cupin family protein
MHCTTHRVSALAFGAALIVVPAIAVACSRNAATTGISEDPTLQWGPAPAVFQPGAQMAVLQGDPSKTAEFTVRLKVPDGYIIAPHTHPTDENVTVIEGTFKVGMGETFNEATMLALPAGRFVTAPALHAHYAKAQGATVVQVHGLGPFALTYVNPNDAPKQIAP